MASINYPSADSQNANRERELDYQSQNPVGMFRAKLLEDIFVDDVAKNYED
jgi:hypothetical protein